MLTMINGQMYENDTINNGNATAASQRTYQITTILDQLLQNYDAQIRPNFGGRRQTFPIEIIHLNKFQKDQLKFNSIS